MDELNTIAYNALNNYFTALSKLGYLSDKKVNQLWLLIFLLEFLERFTGYITEDDYKKIDSIITCIEGSSCLVPYAKRYIAVEPMKNYLLSTPIRETEDSNVRIAETGNLRLPNQL